MIVAKMCQEFEGLSLTIDILNEIRLPATVQTSLEGRNDRGLGNVNNDDISVARKSLGTLGDVALVMPMNDCVKLNSIAIFPAVNKRLGNWYFFNGTGYEVICRGHNHAAFPAIIYNCFCCLIVSPGDATCKQIEGTL